jgi:hypothetical protein
MVLTKIGNDHLHPGTDTCLGNAQPDAAGSPGYKGNFPYEILHVICAPVGFKACRNSVYPPGKTDPQSIAISVFALILTGACFGRRCIAVAPESSGLVRFGRTVLPEPGERLRMAGAMQQPQEDETMRKVSKQVVQSCLDRA